MLVAGAVDRIATPMSADSIEAVKISISVAARSSAAGNASPLSCRGSSDSLVTDRFPLALDGKNCDIRFVASIADSQFLHATEYCARRMNPVGVAEGLRFVGSMLACSVTQLQLLSYEGANSPTPCRIAIARYRFC